MKLKQNKTKATTKTIFFGYKWKHEGDLTSLNPGRAIFIMVVPTILLILIFSTYQIFDKWIATRWGWGNIIYHYGHLTDITSNEAMQIVSIALTYAMVPYLIAISFSLLFAINFTKNKIDKLSNYLGNGSLIIFLFAIVFMIGMYFFIPLIIKFQDGLNSSTNPIIRDIIIDEAVRYSRILIFASPLLFLANFWVSLFCSQGKALISLIIISISFTVNIIFSFIFVIPANLGIEGTAYATIIAWFLICVIAMILIYYHDVNIRINFHKSKLKAKRLLEFFIIGATALLEGLALSILIMMTTKILNSLPPLINYPNKVTMSVYLQLYGGIMPWLVVFNSLAIGVSHGSRILVTYIHQARDYYFLWRVIWRLILILFVLLILGLMLVSIIGQYMMNAFGVRLAMAQDFKRYIIIYFAFYPLATLHFGAILFYQGIKRYKTALFVSLIRTIIMPALCLSLGFIFARDTSDGFYFYMLAGFIDLFSAFLLVPIWIYTFNKIRPELKRIIEKQHKKEFMMDEEVETLNLH